jgi:pimeloyl-ACP methyl ester carboxylesterase
MTVALWIAVAVVALLVLIIAGFVAFAAWTARQVERRLPPHGYFIDVDGERLHYLDEGSGPPLVLIHGLAGQVRVFEHSLLDQLKKDHRVVVVDRPGSGYSTRSRRSSAAISAQAQTISRFIEAVGLKKPVVVGHSLGGAIALALALNHPEQVSGLALLAPLTHPQDEVPPLFQGLVIPSPWLRHCLAWTAAVPVSLRNRKFVLDVAFGPDPVVPDYGTRGGGLLNLRPKSFVSASRDLMATADYKCLTDMQGRYQNLTLPVGVLFGTEDRVLSATKHGTAMAAKVSGLDLELIEGAGHMIPITFADRSAKFITRIVQRVMASSTPASAA